MRVDYRLRDVETETDAGLVESAALVALVEAVENVIDIVVRNTLPLVVDRGIDLARLGDYRYLIRSAITREFVQALSQRLYSI